MLLSLVPVVLMTLWAAEPDAAGVAERPVRPALNGYCPAAYLLRQEAVKGDPTFQSRYAGELYYLSSEKAKQAFDASPERFLPQFGGWCTMALGGPYGNRKDGEPEVFFLHDGKVYLFSSVRARNAYLEAPEGVLERAAERFNVVQLLGYCPASPALSGKAVRGDARYTAVVRRAVYHLASAEAKAAFVKDPDKFLPQYAGFCAASLAANSRNRADPQYFSVYEGKTYLFVNEESKNRFDSDPSESIRKAEENWRLLRGAPPQPGK
ncbi:MAG: hypothetical protein HY763_06445 [Planctomycetes bacterium]|nr:hypothetical protein [Planctomycetota bacterium]